MGGWVAAVLLQALRSHVELLFQPLSKTRLLPTIPGEWHSCMMGSWRVVEAHGHTQTSKCQLVYSLPSVLLFLLVSVSRRVSRVQVSWFQVKCFSAVSHQVWLSVSLPPAGQQNNMHAGVDAIMWSPGVRLIRLSTRHFLSFIRPFSSFKLFQRKVLFPVC